MTNKQQAADAVGFLRSGLAGYLSMMERVRVSPFHFTPYFSTITVLLFLFSRLTLVLSCPMDLKNFPMDSQTCTMQLESCEFIFSPHA